MKQEIRFKGLSLNRDELAAQHGELALCGGVELHDGALRPSVLDGNSLAGGNALTGTLVYIHTNASYKHYISFVNGGLYWAKEVTAGTLTVWDQHPIQNFNYISLQGLSISSVGNTLCVMTSTGIHYILWKEDDYKYLGQQPPFIELQFNMDRVKTGEHEVEIEVEFPNSGGGFISEDHGGDWIQYDQSQIGTGGWVIREGYQVPITEAVMAAGNKLISEATGKGLFHSPFLIRYCYRMYDGTSLIRHSPPVLMMPAISDEITAVVKDFRKSAIANTQYQNFDSKFTCNIEILTAKLNARCLDTSVLSSLVEWKDIIRSLDIFITPQITRIDSASTISFIRMTTQPRLGKGVIEGGYGTYNADDKYHHEEGEGTNHIVYNQGSLDLPKCTEAEYKEKVRNAATFFKLASYKLESIQSVFTSSFSELSLQNNIISNIAVQNQMVDDYKTHNLLVPIEAGKGGMYVYNHRLNVYGISEKLFEGFSAGVLFPYMNSSNNITKVIVTLDTEDGPKRVEKTCNVSYIANAISDYAFYPDPRATGITFVYGNGSSDRYMYKLEEHPSLNGAFYSFTNVNYFTIINSVSDVVPMPNKIYTSRADNPFYFPNLVGESGINSVGSGRIIGIAAVTRALSTGQLGSHDLIAFCTDGIWVLKVSSTGTYSDIHNVSRDVCANAVSICQLDQSVIFATDRSLMKFVESDGMSISDALDGPVQAFSTMMPDFYGLFNTGGLHADTNMKKLLDFGTPAVDYFRNGKVIYDYESRRLIVLPQTVSASTTNVALVFSIDDLSWSTMITPAIRAFLPGYPCPYYQDGNGIMYSLDVPYQKSNRTGCKGIVITRTLTFSETMDIIQGFQQLCNLTTNPLLYIYGSNDQTSWKLIGYSNRPYANYLPGHPFRYFRIAMYLTMAKVERYQELVLDIVNKYAKL